MIMAFAKSRKFNRAPVGTHGFTLVELMISITLGLVLVAGVAYTYLGNRVTYRQQDGLARMQEGARYAFEALDFDIRMTGFVGCTVLDTTDNGNNLNPTTAVDGNLFTQPLTGYQEGVSTFPAAIAASRLRGDAISVLRANTSNEYIVQSHTPPINAVISLVSPHDLQQGEILVISDCKKASTFQMSNTNNNSTTSTVVHNTGAVTSPGNCTKGFGLAGGVPACGTANGIDYEYAPGSRIFRLSGNTYFIGTNAAGQPALFRQRLSQIGGIATAVAEELVEGVEDLQVTYGVDQSPTADKIVDVYVTANLVTAAATPGADDAKKWGRVLSVRVNLLLRSIEDNVTTATQPYTFNGTNTTPADRRLRKVFTTTIAIRNRL